MRIIKILFIISLSFSVFSKQNDEPRVCENLEGIMNCFDNPNDLRKSYIFSHAKKTQKSITLVHGLNGSALRMKELAYEFFNRGYNVIAITLSGHDSKVEDLKDVSHEDWERDVDRGIELAKQYGHEVSVAGFSTGAALVYKRLSNKSSDLDKVLLFSPALGFKSYAPLACDLTFNAIKYLAPYIKDPDSDCYTFKKVSTNSLCQLDDLVDSISSKVEIESQVPLQITLTIEDKLIDIEDVLEKISAYKGPVNLSIYSPLNQIREWSDFISKNYPHLKNKVSWYPSHLGISEKESISASQKHAIEHSTPIQAIKEDRGRVYLSTEFQWLKARLDDFLDN